MSEPHDPNANILLNFELKMASAAKFKIEAEVKDGKAL
jgi:hypothetical protein